MLTTKTEAKKLCRMGDVMNACVQDFGCLSLHFWCGKFCKRLKDKLNNH